MPGGDEESKRRDPCHGHMEEDDPGGFADEILGGARVKEGPPADGGHPDSQEGFEEETEALHGLHDTACRESFSEAGESSLSGRGAVYGAPIHSRHTASKSRNAAVVTTPSYATSSLTKSTPAEKSASVAATRVARTTPTRGGRRSGIASTAKSAPLALAFETSAAVNVEAEASPNVPSRSRRTKSGGSLISKPMRTTKSGTMKAVTAPSSAMFARSFPRRTPDGGADSRRAAAVPASSSCTNVRERPVIAEKKRTIQRRTAFTVGLSSGERRGGATGEATRARTAKAKRKSEFTATRVRHSARSSRRNTAMAAGRTPAALRGALTRASLFRPRARDRAGRSRRSRRFPGAAARRRPSGRWNALPRRDSRPARRGREDRARAASRTRA